METMLELSCTLRDGQKVRKYIFVGQCVWLPMVQTYVRGYPVGREVDDNGFTLREDACPWVLRLASTRSRLCLPPPYDPKFVVLFHETSDEIAKQLANCQVPSKNGH